MSAPPLVLVVEDNPELRNVLKEALGAEGYVVLAARDDEQAFELLRANSVDLMISDLTDPPAATRTLEEVREEFPRLPVVALSNAAGGHPTLFLGDWDGGAGFRTLSKPFRLGELIQVSREVLGPAQAPS